MDLAAAKEVIQKYKEYDKWVEKSDDRAQFVVICQILSDMEERLASLENAGK
jgi:bacterioferritin (cytochrome b1)